VFCMLGSCWSAAAFRRRAGFYLVPMAARGREIVMKNDAIPLSIEHLPSRDRKGAVGANIRFSTLRSIPTVLVAPPLLCGADALVCARRPGRAVEKRLEPPSILGR